MIKLIVVLSLSVLSVEAGLSKLEALSMIESGDNDRAIGSAGEVSRYQIMPEVWKSYTRSNAYRNKAVSERIARKHLDFLEGVFRRRTGREPTDFDRYVLWNAGAGYYARVDFSPEKVHPVIRNRANRFVNLRELGGGPQIAASGD